jgi:hypothetical protein
MPGTLTGPPLTGIGSGGEDVWLIIQGLQDQLDGFARARTGWRGAVAVVSTADVATRSGLLVIDGYTLVDGDRVLLAAQSNQVTGGLWLAHSGPWTRPSDFASVTDAAGAVVAVNGGTVNAGTEWVLPSTTPVYVDVNPQAWRLAASASAVAAEVARATAAEATKLPLTGAGLGGATVSAQQLIDWTLGESFALLSATYDGNGIMAAATVRWPDASAGVLTVTATDIASKSINAYTLTHALSGKTVTQTAVTRDASGNVTVSPALTVA